MATGTATCILCGGTGIFIAHPNQGTGIKCFRCHGSGQEPTKEERSSQYQQRKTAKAEREARVKARQEAREKELQVLSGGDPVKYKQLTCSHDTAGYSYRREIDDRGKVWLICTCNNCQYQMFRERA